MGDENEIVQKDLAYAYASVNDGSNNFKRLLYIT